MDRRPRMPFTLLEAMVTMLIMAVLSALLIGAFHTGAMSYGKTEAYERSAAELSGALALLKEDLRSLAPVEGGAVEFSEGKLAFYVASAKPSSHLELVSYSAKGSSLTRSAASYLGRGLNEEPASTETSTLLEGLESWKFNYLVETELELKAQEPSFSQASGKEKGPAWPKAISIEGADRDGRPILASMLAPSFNSPRSSGAPESKKGGQP